MKVEILVVPDCPHEAQAAQLLRTALDDVGLSHVEPTVRVIFSAAAAAEEGFAGSPTFAVDGQDLFPAPDPAGALACRLYDGPGGLPGLRDLRQALKQAAAVATTR